MVNKYLLKFYSAMGNCHTVGPNEALVRSGGCCGNDAKKTVIGGWVWAWWLVTDVQSITLEVMTLNPRCEKVETAQGVAVTVTGVAQVSDRQMETIKDLVDCFHKHFWIH